jgi:hypothetical protein
MNITIRADNLFSNTIPPPTNTHKHTLEVSTAEFVKKGWKLLFEIHPTGEYTTATVFLSN